MKKFAIMTMKGGTGKTTTAVSIAHGFALSGRRALLIDCDPQRNATVTFGVEAEKGLAELLTTGDTDILQVRENLFIIDSGGRRLADVELELGGAERREDRLRRALQLLKGCDFVVCDCPPSMNLINVNVLSFCDEVIIPLAMDFLSQVGADQTIDIIEEMTRMTDRKGIGFHILPTFYDGRTRISRVVLDEVRERFADRVFRTTIRINTSIREAPGKHKTIYEHAPLSRGSFDYYRLTEEILELVADE